MSLACNILVSVSSWLAESSSSSTLTPCRIYLWMSYSLELLLYVQFVITFCWTVFQNDQQLFFVWFSSFVICRILFLRLLLFMPFFVLNIRVEPSFSVFSKSSNSLYLLLDLLLWPELGSACPPFRISIFPSFRLEVFLGLAR